MPMDKDKERKVFRVSLPEREYKDYEERVKREGSNLSQKTRELIEEYLEVEE